MFSQGYIGVSKNVQQRFKQHLKRSENPHLKYAINKYGWDNLVKEQIIISDKQYCLNLEKQLRPVDNIGWNLISGGGCPPRAKKGIGLGRTPWNKGKTYSEETRKKISENTRLQMQDPVRKEINRKLLAGKPSLMTGRKHTAESLSKMSESHKGNTSRRGAVNTQETIDKIKATNLKNKWTCPHCAKEGLGKATANRWHFDNCKNKE